MSGDEITRADGSAVERRLRQELKSTYEPKSRRRFKKLLLAAMGAIPWVGGLIAGLANLRDRVESVGGTLTTESEPGAGTQVRVRLPVGAAARSG